MGNQLVDGWNKFWNAVPNSAGGSTLLAIAGGAIMAWFLFSWFWKKTRGGGGGGNAMQGFPWWPMGVGLLLTAPAFLIPTVLRVIQAIIGLVDTILKTVTQTLS